eukprot:6302538-Prymnesium_polylepis.1
MHSVRPAVERPHMPTPVLDHERIHSARMLPLEQQSHRPAPPTGASDMETAGQQQKHRLGLIKALPFLVHALRHRIFVLLRPPRCRNLGVEAKHVECSAASPALSRPFDHIQQRLACAAVLQPPVAVAAQQGFAIRTLAGRGEVALQQRALIGRFGLHLQADRDRHPLLECGVREQ